MCSVAVVHLHVRLDAHLNGVIGYDTHIVGTSVDDRGNGSPASLPSGMWILSLIPFTGIRSVIHSHRGTGFLNQFSSGMWIHQELILIKGFVL